MIYGYIRVSCDKQTVKNQKFEITNFCKMQNIYIDGWIEETISQRTKEALSRKKAEGIKLGRPKGRKIDPKKASTLP